MIHMVEQREVQELSFSQARAQLEEEALRIRDLSQSAQHMQLPALQFTKGESKFTFDVPSIEKETIYDALALITRYIENVRIQSFEQNFVSFQDAGPLYKPYVSPYDGIRFKFIFLTSHALVETQKRGNLNQNEVHCCIALLKFFLEASQSQKQDPALLLEKLGARILLPPQKTAQEGQREDTKAEQQKDSGRLRLQGFAGYHKVREEILETILLPLRHPEIFDKVAQATRGAQATNKAGAILFQGPAGVGKSTMAQLIAQQSRLPMVYIAIENVLSKYYGESAQNLAAIFDTAAMYERALIFIDEIDALATSREGGLFEATRRLLSVLLRKIDSIEKKESVLTIGATNRREDLDPALLSRFDTVIHFPLPQARERAMIFAQYAGHLEQAQLEALALASEGMAGRNIEDLCQYTERKWARILIARKQEPCPPPKELYLTVTKSRSQN